MGAEVVRLRAVVHGRVQMVGFRAFVMRHAGDAGLAGTVRNEPDGTVETVLEGPRPEVERMLELLQRRTESRARRTRRRRVQRADRHPSRHDGGVMTIRFADRLNRLGTESAFEVLAHARLLEAEGRSIVHLEIGEPDFATPDNIIDAAVRAMRDGATHYTAASGIREVREKTAAYVTRHTGVPTAFENIVLTPGSKNLLLFALLSLVEEGDEVIVPDPGYPIYRSLVEFIGAKAVSLPLRQENDFRADVDELARLITPRTRMLVVNSPQNPTGGILTRDDCERIAALAIEHDLIVLSDEIYNRLSYDGDPRLPLRHRRDGRTHHLHGRALQGVGDVRLASGLRCDAGRDREEDGHADDQQLVVRRGIHAVGGR